MFAQMWWTLTMASMAQLFWHSQALNCSAGEYLSAAGACAPCSEGSFNDATTHALLNCESCAAGTWAPTTGMTSCLTCPANSASFAGASSCSYTPQSCYPCTDRSQLKIRVVSHGVAANSFWRRMLRVMTVAGQMMNVNLVVKLQQRESLMETTVAIQEALDEEPDALIVTLPSSGVLDAVKTAAQTVLVFSFNTGNHVAEEVGSLGHFGMDEDAAGYACGSEFETKLSSAGAPLSVCLVLYSELDNEAMAQRTAGFQRACLEIGATLMATFLLTGTSAEQQAAAQAQMESFLSAHSNSEGLAVLLLNEGPFSSVVDAWTALGGPSNVKIGTFDLPRGLDDGIASGAVAFGVDQGEFMQAYLSVVLTTLYVTTGQALASKHFRTGPTFVTEPRDADVALRAIEGFPICDCPWVGGLEDVLQCGPDVPGIEPIGECPVDSCSSPCLDIRKFSVQGVVHGAEANSFWGLVKAGSEQAANDLRLINHKLDLFKPTGTDSAEVWSFDANIQAIADAAADDSVDALWCSIVIPTYIPAVQAAAEVKPVILTNAGDGYFESVQTETNHLLHYAGQDERQGGRAAGQALVAAGVTHLACYSFFDFPVFDDRCGGAEEVFVEAGLNYTFVALYSGDYGTFDSGSDALAAGCVTESLMQYPTIDGMLVLGGVTYGYTARGWIESGRSIDDLVIATFDTDAYVIDLIDQGKLVVGIDQQPYFQGYMSVLLLGIYHMSGNRLMDWFIKTGPSVRDSLKASDECAQVPWTMLAEGSLTDPIVGETFLPSWDASSATGYPICERDGSCEGAGSYFNMQTAACEPCPAGTYANSSMVSCEICPAGTSTKGNGGSPACYPCGQGLFSEMQGSASCDYCDLGTYSAVEGMSACSICRTPFSTAKIARDSPDACMCPEGMYGVGGNYSADGQCLPCPEGLVCSFGSHEDYGTRPVVAVAFPSVQVGFMTKSESRLMPYRCLLEEWCPGGATETCASNRDSGKVACGTCMDGFYLADHVCSPCESTLSPTLILTIMVGFALIVGATLMANTGSHLRSQSNLIVLIMASLLFTNFQALSVFDNLSFEWFEPVKTILSRAGEISFNVQIVKGVCMMHLDSISKFTLIQLGIPLSVPWCWIIVLGKKHFPMVQFRRPNTDVGTEVTTAIGSLMGMFFISILMSCLSPFVCFHHPGSAGSSVRTASEILCTWDGDHLQMVITALISMLLVPIPFFANACYVTYQYSKTMALEARGKILHKYRFLFFRFHPKAYYYGLALVVRSLAICLVPVVIRDDAGMQIFLLAIIIICFAEFQSFLQPWRASVCNYVDALFAVLLLALLVCAPMAAGIETDRRPLQLLGFTSILGIMVIGVCALALGIIKFFRRTPYFDLFLCHHKEHAAAQVRFIKSCVANTSKLNVFIDSDNLVNLDRLFDTVKNHVGLFVAYLTACTLQRAWCCGEVVSAHAVRLKMKAIFTPSFAPPTLEQLQSLDSYVRGLDDTLSHYGISSAAVRIALEALLHPIVPRIELSKTAHSGTNRFVWIARSLLGRPENSFKSTIGFEVAISSPGDDDEGIAAAGYMAMKIRLLLSEFDGGGEVLCLCDHKASGNKEPDFEEARAVVVIFSAASLQNANQLMSVVSAMEIAEAHSQNGTPFAVIPVHLPGLAFPNHSYFEEDFPALWNGRTALCRAQELLQTCFKTISVLLEINGSEVVLSAQVNSIFHRIPPSEARRNLQGSVSNASSMAALKSSRGVKARPSGMSNTSSNSTRNGTGTGTGSCRTDLECEKGTEIEDVLIPHDMATVTEMNV